MVYEVNGTYHGEIDEYIEYTANVHSKYSEYPGTYWEPPESDWYDDVEIDEIDEIHVYDVEGNEVDVDWKLYEPLCLADAKRNVDHDNCQWEYE